MTVFQVFVVVLGLIIIAASYIISEKIFESKSENLDKREIDPEVLQEEKEKFKKYVDHIISEIGEDVEVETNQRLSKISNEKITSLTELSEQTLEKIGQNHTEVVFLYNMLNEKETELKSMLSRIEKEKAEMEKGIRTFKIKLLEIEKIESLIQKRQQKFIEKQGNLVVAKDMTDENVHEAAQTKQLKERVLRQKLESELDKEKTQEKQEQNKETPKKPVTSDKVLEPEFFEQPVQNSNDRILALYEEGKSILEISRILELGQGEVRLVIDLFKGVDS